MLFFSQNRKSGDRQSRLVQLCKGLVKRQDSCYLPALPFLTCSFCPHGHKWLRHFQASHLSSRLGERVRGKSFYQLNLCPFIKETIPVQKPQYKKSLYVSLATNELHGPSELDLEEGNIFNKEFCCPRQTQDCVRKERRGNGYWEATSGLRQDLHSLTQRRNRARKKAQRV